MRNSSADIRRSQTLTSARPGSAIALTLALLVVTQLSACGRTLSPRAVPDLASQLSAAEHSVYFTAGEIRGLSHPHFDRTHAKAGLWEPLATLEEIGAGIYFSSLTIRSGFRFSLSTESAVRRVTSGT